MLQRSDFVKQVWPFVGTDLVKVFTGIRRCGKSVVMTLVQDELRKHGTPPENMLFFNFEDIANAPLCTAEALHEHIKERIKGVLGRVYLFFDEIQEVAQWERCVNSLRVTADVDIFITGSNSTLLSGELATYLAGRYVEIQVYPFSFAEFLEMYQTLEPDITPRDAFNRYLIFGGLPFLHNLAFQEEPCMQYLRDVYSSVIVKDMVKRGNIRDVDLLERIVTYVMAHIGQTFSATSISNYFRSNNRMVSPETILNYLKVCEHAFLFYPVRRQDLAGKKILQVQEKYYLADHGLREAVYRKNARDIQLVLENIVHLELRRRGYRVTVGKLYDAEIDFVGERQGELVYVQVTYYLAAPETLEREFGPLERVKDNYPKYVLSLDEIDLSRNGIRHCNIRDFLLSKTGKSPEVFP
jgi:predicted AAA+ superfamily ATPase